jgi:hypothetical protein
MNASDLIKRLQTLVDEHGDFPVSLSLPTTRPWENGEIAPHAFESAFCEVAEGLHTLCLWPVGDGVPEHQLREEFNIAQGNATYSDDYKTRTVGCTGQYTQMPSSQWVQEAIESDDKARMEQVRACLDQGNSTESFRLAYAMEKLKDKDAA